MKQVLEVFFHDDIGSSLIVCLLHLVDITGTKASKYVYNSIATKLILSDYLV